MTKLALAHYVLSHASCGRRYAGGMMQAFVTHHAHTCIVHYAPLKEHT